MGKCLEVESDDGKFLEVESNTRSVEDAMGNFWRLSLIPVLWRVDR